MKENRWKVFAKGFVIGGTMIVPGVSGGTMAIILGIYDKLIAAVGRIRKQPKASLLFLCIFCAGAGLGLFLFTVPVSRMLEHYENPTLGFFTGAVVGGMPVLCRHSGVEKVRLESFLWVSAGAAATLLCMFLPAEVIMPGKSNELFLVMAGVLSSVALILPGISFSHFLLLLGLYESLLESIQKLELGFLIPLGVGIGAGILIFCRILERMMERFPRQSYLLILGFVVGAVGQIMPLPSSMPEIAGCLVSAGAGFFLIYRNAS